MEMAAIEQIDGVVPAGADEPLVLVTADSHVGPRLNEDLRKYCEQKHLAAFDEWVGAVQSGIMTHYEELPASTRDAIDWNAQSEGHFDVHARIRDMDADGVAAEVVFHG